MASVKDHKSHDMGLHKEVLTGRTQQVFLILKSLKTFFIMTLTTLILTNVLQ